MTTLEEIMSRVGDGPGYVSGNFLKTLIGALIADRCRLGEGFGHELRTPNGRWIFPRHFSAQNIGLSPFELVNASTSGAVKIRVVYGTVNGVAPDGMSPGDTPQYVLTVSDSGSIYLIVTVDSDGHVNSRTIGNGVSMPADTDTTFHQEIGSYSVSGGILSIAQSISGSQQFELCGGIEPLWGLV